MIGRSRKSRIFGGSGLLIFLCALPFSAFAGAEGLSAGPKDSGHLPSAPVLPTANKLDNELDEIPLGDSNYTGLKVITLYRKDACIKTLKPIISPEEVIAAGLAALQEGSGPNAELSCLEEIANDWNKLVPAAPSPSFTGGEVVPGLAELWAKYTALDKEVDCTPSIPLDDPKIEQWKSGMNGYCQGKFTDPSEKEAKKKALAELGKEVSLLQFERTIASGITEFAENLFAKEKKALNNELNERLSSLSKRLACFGKNLPEWCNGQALTSAERDATAKKRDLLEAEYSKKKFEFTAQEGNLEEILGSSTYGAQYFDRDGMIKAYKKLRCLKKTNTSESDTLKTFCEKYQLPTNGDEAAINAANAEVMSFMPDPKAATEKWKADEAVRKADAEKRAKERSRGEQARYDLRRLVTLYGAYAKKHPGPTALEEFCAQNEATQIKDLEFAKKTKKFAQFNKESEWKWAKLHGISEAELAAIKEYTGSYYHQLNPAIWKANAKENPQPLNEAHAAFVETINRGLGRVPAYREKPVRRFSRLPDSVLAEHEEGKIITYSAFTSTSKREDWNWHGGASMGVHGFIIYPGNSGVDVDEVSSAQGEGEVLFKAGTRFKVLSRKARPNGAQGFDFVMAEVDENGNVIGSVPAPEEKAP